MEGVSEKGLAAPRMPDDVQGPHILAKEILEGTPLLRTPFRQVVRTMDGKRVIKAGPGGRILKEEMDAMQFVARYTNVPVPDGSTLVSEGGRNFLVMDYVEGQTLRDAWPTLVEEDRCRVLQELKSYIGELKQLAPPCGAIGSITGGGCLDCWVCPELDPPRFPDECAWNERLISRVTKAVAAEDRRAALRRLPTDSDIRVCHADLRPSNILVQNGRVVCILDWEMAGWYPAYWEWCQATANINDDLEGWRDHLTAWLGPRPAAYEEIAWIKSRSCPW